MNNQFIKEIYYHNKPLIITNAAEQYLSQHSFASSYLLLHGAIERNLTLALHQLENNISPGVIIHDLDAESLEKLLDNNFLKITAAGGLVINNEGALLMIYRRGYWDLPKGKWDEGETFEDCAVREVTEETGVINVNNESFLETTYHIYYSEWDKKTILKNTEWFKMSISDNQVLTAQTEEDIEQATWLQPAEVIAILPKAYPIIQYLVKHYYL